MTGLLVTVVSAVLTAAALALLVPVTVLGVQATSYLLTRRRSEAVVEPGGLRPHVAVVMPAHDEAQVIAGTVTALRPQLVPGDRLLVVADNCTDATADLARAAGAEVTERQDPVRRGKGYALDWGVNILSDDPPEVVVVVDADCAVEPGALERLARAAFASGRPVQARYVMELPPDPPLKLRVAAFAWHVKGEVRAGGYHGLGLPCQLMGTGMAFPWAVIRHAALASGNIVEDVQLGVDLAVEGVPPRLQPDATVRSWFPATVVGAESQRTRWEHGHLGIMATAIPRLVREALRQRRLALAAMALDFCVPPLALLVVVLSAVLAANGAWWMATGAVLGIALSGVAALELTAVIAAAWSTGGYRVLPASQLAGLPLYVLAKIPMYLRLLTGRRQKEWVRTERDVGDS